MPMSAGWSGGGGLSRAEVLVEQSCPGFLPGPVLGQVQGNAPCGGGDARGDADKFPADRCRCRSSESVSSDSGGGAGQVKRHDGQAVPAFHLPTITLPAPIHYSMARPGVAQALILQAKAHAKKRQAQRQISDDMVDQAVSTGKPTKGNKAGTTKYVGRKIWVVKDSNGNTRSVGWN